MGNARRARTSDPEATVTPEALLFERSAEGDSGAREQIVSRFLPMARRLALRYRRGGEPADDLVQVASMGLVKAVERFDHRRGAPFASYAVPTIDGELKRHLRDTSWAAHVPQRMRERVREVERASERLRLQLGRSPTIGRSGRERRPGGDRRARGRRRRRPPTTPSRWTRPPATRRERRRVARRWAPWRSATSWSSYGVTLGPAIRALPARQRAILLLRFEEDMTQSEIAQVLGISQMHVSRLLRQALGASARRSPECVTPA